MNQSCQWRPLFDFLHLFWHFWKLIELKLSKKNFLNIGRSQIEAAAKFFFEY